MCNMDILYEAVAERGHVCVGLDTTAEYVPEKERRGSDAESVLFYNKAIIDSTIDVVACYKVQIAYYEEMGIAGLKAFSETLKYLRLKAALIISDIKRGDIADTASRYAKGHFDGEFETDFVTLSPYMGMDSIEPWFEWADKKGKGAFVLMRTSNKGRNDFECLELKDGRRLYNAVGDKLADLAAIRPGKHGYGAFGAVIGINPQSEEELKEAKSIRSDYTNLFFLIPGYGTQGGAASDVALLLKEGNGGVVNASRSLLKAWHKAAQEQGSSAAEANNDIAAMAARQAAIEMRDAILKASGR